MVRQASLQIGIGLNTASGPADDAGALIDLDFSTNRYRVRGRSFESQTAMRAALGGILAANGQLQIGPHVPTNASNLVLDGSFSNSIGDWQTNGGALAIVDGQLQASGIGGNTTSAHLPINPHVSASGRAYRLHGRVRRGTAGSVQLAFGSPFSPHLYAGSSGISSTTLTEVELFCGGFHPANAMIALRNNSNPSSGTFFLDDVSLREVLPMEGFLAGHLCGLIEATTPANGGSEQVLFQADDNANFNNSALERNFIRLMWGADERVRFVVSVGGSGSIVETANLDLGVVAPGASFSVAFSARADDFKATLLGQPVRSDTSGAFPGLATLRLGKGRSDVDCLWSGTINRLKLFSHAMSDNEFLALAAGNGIVAWGDSLTAGTGASGVAQTYPAIAQGLFSPPRAVVKLGIGGQTSTQIAARMNARPISVSVAGGSIPASGGVAVTAKSINILTNAGAYAGSQVGWLGGIKGVMTTDAAGNGTFTRSSAGTATAVPAGSRFICELGEVLRPRIAWLWLGRNGAQQGFDVFDDIEAAVASLRHNRFVVGSVLVPTDPDDPASLNARLSARYGARFADVLGALRTAHDGSGTDLADVEAGRVPGSLRSDDTHLNDAGYAIVAAAFHNATLAMGF